MRGFIASVAALTQLFCDFTVLGQGVALQVVRTLLWLWLGG